MSSSCIPPGSLFMHANFDSLYLIRCSGLDSTTALLLVESLRALASGGRAIITTIHQPSSRLYQLLDKIMLLSDGHVMYYGKVRPGTAATPRAAARHIFSYRAMDVKNQGPVL